MVDPPSTQLAGRYRLLDEVGRGGMGVVWQAYDETLRRQVAVKELVLPPGLPEEELSALRQRSMQEARAAGSLDHPGIIAIYDVLFVDGRPWIVMPLVQGRSLERIVSDEGKLPPQRAADIGKHLLEALRAAHQQGVLHRDVTPRNVLVADDGRVLLTDFGIAAVADATVALTQTGLVMGSVGYVAPERFSDNEIGPASDLWSLGATLYYAVEGEHAFHGDSVAALVGAVLTQGPPATNHAAELGPVLTGLLQREVTDRWDVDRAANGFFEVATGTGSSTTTEKSNQLSTATPPSSWAPGTVRIGHDSFEISWTGKEPLSTYAPIRVSIPNRSWFSGLLARGDTGRLRISELARNARNVRGVRTRPRNGGWSLRIGRRFITTTSAAGKRTFRWHQIESVTIEPIRTNRDAIGSSPRQYTALHIKPTSTDNQPRGAPAGWSEPAPTTIEDRDDGRIPICVIGPTTDQQRQELLDALGKLGGRRWRSPAEWSSEPRPSQDS